MSALAQIQPSEAYFAGDLHLSEDQKALIRETFARLEPAGDLVAALFYLRLFDLDPSLRGIFKGSIKAQGRKFMGALKIAIISLDHRDGLAPTLRLLGARHRQYGVRPGFYLTFTMALIWTFEQSLDSAFTPAAKIAWTTFLAQMTRAMSL